jgi:hypothetical protein
MASILCKVTATCYFYINIPEGGTFYKIFPFVMYACISHFLTLMKA